ncbi:hypothetical protein VTO42DRAFT_5212 [Malbranchea cinnamomea]
MVEFIPPPDPRTLLPPLLACLPAAFAASRPPPALFPLLSPILRQRVQVFTSLSPSTSSSSSDTWLRLLCWDAAKAARVENIVGNTTFEPHPVSGDIEISDDLPITYKCVDQETLRSRLPLQEYNLAVVYVWCPGDHEGGNPGWRVTEIVPLESLHEENDVWLASIKEANDYRQESIIKEALKEAEALEKTAQQETPDDDDDDAYWAQYDITPGRTPAPKTSPGPRFAHGTMQSTSEDSYFSRYADVQPALDNDDPSVNRDEVGESSLNGDAVARLLRRHAESISEQQRSGVSEAPRPGVLNPRADSGVPLNHPRPSSPSSGSVSVSKLEETAETVSAAEVGVRQHISSNIKSLFRLARTTGISKSEFESLVMRELETLDMLAMDD